MGEGKGLYRVLGGDLREREHFGRPRPRQEDNIKDGYSGSGMWGYGLDRAGSG
jgi:hypothetical protein